MNGTATTNELRASIKDAHNRIRDLEFHFDALERKHNTLLRLFFVLSEKVDAKIAYDKND